jgi:hypothetical protein
MKPWQWAALGLGAIIVIVVIAKSSQPAVPSAINGEVTAAAGLGGLLAGLFKGSSAPTKVSAPSAGYVAPGSSGNAYDGLTPAQYYSQNYNGLSPQSYGAQYSAAMASTGEVASGSAGSGGTNSGGGLTGATDPLGIGSLTAPSFDVGTSGSDFSN